MLCLFQPQLQDQTLRTNRKRNMRNYGAENKRKEKRSEIVSPHEEIFVYVRMCVCVCGRGNIVECNFPFGLKLKLSCFLGTSVLKGFPHFYWLCFNQIFVTNNLWNNGAKDNIAFCHLFFFSKTKLGTFESVSTFST